MNSPEASAQKILFIYNAESGMGNALLDYGKKYIAPSKYDCQLCMLSYGPFGMKRDWKIFLSKLPYPTEFLHKDELRNSLPDASLDLPAVVIVNGASIEKVLLSGKDFADIRSLDQLKESITRSLDV